MLNTSRLRSLREESRESQDDLAGLLNVSREAYCLYENGHRNPSTEYVETLASHYSVSTDYLLDLTEVPYSTSDLNAKQRYVLRHLRSLNDETLSIIMAIINK